MDIPKPKNLVANIHLPVWTFTAMIWDTLRWNGLLFYYIYCTQVYLDNREAHGFTWYTTNQVGLCVLFDEARGTEEACENCVSFRYNDDLECHQMDGACAKGGNFLYRSTYLPGHGSADNELICWLQCLAFDGCRYYSWFRRQYPIPDECQFFSSCDLLIPDDQGTVTGYIDLDLNIAKNWLDF